MKLKFAHIYIPAVLVIWLGLFLDSSNMAQHISYGQNITNIIVCLVFVWIFFHVSKITKQLMLFGLIIAYIGEVTLSLGLGMYTYRLEHVPFYVPLGHTIVYAGIYYITKEPWVRQHQQNIIRLLYPIMIIYSTLWFFFAHDALGFVCMLAVVVLFKIMPETKLFFLLMFFMVVYLELLGTHYQSWHWPELWFGMFTWMPSANPPSGIGVIYFAFDALCLLGYKHFNLKIWRRFRRIQKLTRSHA